MRTCAECEKEKLETEFSTSQLARNYSICRDCNTLMSREYRLKNKEKMKEYDKQYGKLYYENHKNEILEQAKQYYEINREERLIYNKQYYQNNREDFIAYSKEYQKNNAEKINKYHNERNKQLRETDPGFNFMEQFLPVLVSILNEMGKQNSGSLVSNILIILWMN